MLDFLRRDDGKQQDGDKVTKAVAPIAHGTAFHEQHPWLFRWPPLLFSVFWIMDRIRYHATSSWLLFFVFYLVFLLAFFRTFSYQERYPHVWLGVLFLLGYLYVPFDLNASGEFVFPVVMSVFFIRRPNMASAFRTFAAVEILSAAGVALEMHCFHIPVSYTESSIFYMVTIGLCNFAYAQHVQASEQLELANQEIEHLAQIAERARIARDLHDLLGHTLTVIVLKSDVANRLFSIQPELAHREIAEVEATARKALAEVRGAVTGYTSEGFPAEIARARRALATAGVQMSTDLENVPLNGNVETTLCLILREAVTNVLRHAQATACGLVVCAVDEQIRMTIEDNGTGVVRGEGNGLHGMRQRLAHHGGTLSLTQAPSGGTRLVAELPLHDLAPAKTGTAPASFSHGATQNTSFKEVTR